MAESPLAALNRGLIQGLAIGQEFRRTRRQEEAEKTLRELQERRLRNEEEGLKLRKRQVNISERSALANLIKIPNPKTRKLAIKAFLRGKNVPVDDPSVKELLDGLSAMEDDEKAAAVAIIQSFDLGMGVKEMHAAGLLSIDKIFAFGAAKRKQEATQKFKRSERLAGEVAKATQAKTGTFQGRIDQAVEAGTLTKERGEELKRQRFEKEATPAGPLVDLGGLADKEQVKALTKLRTNINKQKQVATIVIRKANRIVEVLADDATPIAVVGFVSRMGNSLKEQARAIAIASGIDFGPERFDFGSFVDQTAIKAVQIRTNVISLAFSIAKRDNEGRVTQQDVQAALDQIAAGSGSGTQMKAALGEIVTNAINSIDDFVAITQPSFKGTKVSPPSLFREDLKRIGIEPLSRLNAGLPEGIPPGSRLVDQTKEGLPVYETPDGRKLVVE